MKLLRGIALPDFMLALTKKSARVRKTSTEVDRSCSASPLALHYLGQGLGPLRSLWPGRLELPSKEQKSVFTHNSNHFPK